MTDIAIGSTDLVDLKQGTNTVLKVYQGSTEIWANVPNINFDTNGWTSGQAGSIWTLSEEVTDASGFVTNPSFNTTLMRIRHEVRNVGYFDPVYQQASCSVPDFNSTGSYRLHYNLAAVVNSPRGISNMFISVTGGAVSNSSTNINTPTSGTGSFDFTVTGTSGGCTIILRNNFANTAGTQSGDGGRLDINGVYLEKL